MTSSPSPSPAPTWEPPGPGSWIIDRSHGPKNPTRLYRRMVGEYTKLAYREGMAELGAGLDCVDMQVVNGKLYRRIVPLVGARFDTGKVPPKPIMWLASRAHPKFRAREKLAAQTLVTKPYRAAIERWHQSERQDWEDRNRYFQNMDVDAMDAAQLADHVRSLDAHLVKGWLRHHRLHVYDLGPIGDLLAHGEGWGMEPLELMLLLRGSSPATTEAAAHGAHIAETLRAGGVDPATVEDVAAIRSVPEAAAALAEYMDVFGWRLIVSYDIEGQTLHELPSAVCTLVRAAATGTDEAAGVDLESEADLRSRAGDPALFDELLADARAAYGLRDDNGPLTWEWPAGLMRRAFLAAGRLLVDAGLLEHEIDIFELDSDEVADALQGRTSLTTADIDARVQHRIWEGTFDGPDTLGPPPVLDPDISALPPSLRRLMGIVLTASKLLEPDTETERAPLAGLGIGTAPYRGVARVADDPNVAIDAMQPGDILVAPWTAPSYNAVLSIAGGIVVQEGGVLSHAAVMARELDLPAVIGCSEAMARINNGDIIEIDPTAGAVTIIEPAP